MRGHALFGVRQETMATGSRSLAPEALILDFFTRLVRCGAFQPGFRDGLIAGGTDDCPELASTWVLGVYAGNPILKTKEFLGSFRKNHFLWNVPQRGKNLIKPNFFSPAPTSAPPGLDSNNAGLETSYERGFEDFQECAPGDALGPACHARIHGLGSAD